MEDVTDVGFSRISLGYAMSKDFVGYVSYTLFPLVPLRHDSFVTKVAISVAGYLLVVIGLLMGNRLSGSLAD